MTLLLPLSLLCCITVAQAQGPFRSIEVSLSAKSHTFFEGEPIYLLVTVRNTSAIPQALPVRDMLARENELSVRDSAGRDLRRRRVFIDVLYHRFPLDTLPPGGTWQWVTPLHWFWGTHQEDVPWSHDYSFTAGQYKATVVFPAQWGIPGASIAFRVRTRTQRQDRARDTYLSRAGRAWENVRRSRVPDSALIAIIPFLRDTSLRAYWLVLAADFTASLSGMADRHTAPFLATMDEIKAMIAADPGTPEVERIRFIEAIQVERLDSLRNAIPSLAALPIVSQRIREYERRRAATRAAPTGRT